MDSNKATASHSFLTIIISGGSIGGLATAHSLSSKFPNSKITIFEKNANLSQHPAHSLSLRGDTGGVQALEKLCLIENIKKVRTPSKEFFIALANTKTFSKVISIKGDNTRPEETGLRVQKLPLLQAMIDALPSHVEFYWNSKVVDVERGEGSDAKEKVILQDGSEYFADLVVVCEGAGSLLRKKLFPNEKLSFAGFNMIAGKVGLKDIPCLGHESHGMCLSNEVFLWLSHEVDGYNWSFAFRAEKPFSRDELKKEKKVEYQKRALELAQNFPKFVSKMVEESEIEDITLLSAHDKMPHGSIGKIVFVGDATHPVTPMSGNGANIALVNPTNNFFSFFNLNVSD